MRSLQLWFVIDQFALVPWLRGWIDNVDVGLVSHDLPPFYVGVR